jgi:hypothetical protein
MLSGESQPTSMKMKFIWAQFINIVIWALFIDTLMWAQFMNTNVNTVYEYCNMSSL